MGEKARGSWLFSFLLLLALFDIFADAGDEVDEVINRALKMESEGDYERALETIDNIPKIAPDNAHVVLLQGRLLVKLNDISAAQKKVKKAMQMFRKHGMKTRDGTSLRHLEECADVLIRTVSLAYERGSQENTRMCKDALLYRPEHALCYYLYSVHLLTTQKGSEQADNDRKVLTSLHNSIRLGHRSQQVNAYFALGMFHLQRGHLISSASAYESALKLAPSSADVLMRVGELRSRLGQHRMAQEAYERAWKEKPKDGDVMIQVGSSLRRQKKYKEAIKQYRKVVRLSTASEQEWSDAQAWIGNVYELMGKHKEAEAAYRQVIARVRRHGRACNNLGSILMARNDEEAFSSYMCAIEADPTMFEAYNNVGGYLMGKGNASEALPYLQVAYSLDQSEPQLIFNLGLALRKTGSSHEGISYMRKALSMRHTNKDFYWELARSYLYEDKMDLMLSTLDAMSRSLGKQWGELEAGLDADKFIHAQNARALNFYKRKKGRGIGKKSSGRLQKGVILYLCCADEDELKDLHYSLKLLYNHFTKEFSYPVIILHDRLTQENQTTLSAVFGDGNLSFHRIELAFPPEMTEQEKAKIPPYLMLAGHRWSYGYRHMSRFFCHDMFYLDVLQPFDYYWRLDADSFLLSPIPFDVFDRMARDKLEYGYMVVTQEDEEVVKGLWDVTRDFVHENNISLSTTMLSHHVGSSLASCHLLKPHSFCRVESGIATCSTPTLRSRPSASGDQLPTRNSSTRSMSLGGFTYTGGAMPPFIFSLLAFSCRRARS
uniref:Protein O-GlcNAc transferase n=1 Tax=Guillardia theta TaxID=55529 RepID=A0A7S4PF26_GUITH|mmetsp:Transcript_49240/g.154507  ORF Transcript_49240/g.154507 Transcript_49240/m.154507 type:complete len:775 (+) Transcript_49240:125-2449(+)